MNDYLTIEEANLVNGLMPGNLVAGVGNKLRSALMGAYIYRSVDKYYVDSYYGNDENNGLSWEKAFKTIMKAVNVARYIPGTTTIDYTDKWRDKYIFIAPGQYNEQLLFSGYNIHLIGKTGGARLSNKDYGVTINYDGAVASTCVVGFTGAGIELANLTIHCDKAIPALFIPTPGDGCWIHDCYFTGDDAKTPTFAIDGNSIKTTVIENNLIEGFATGIDVGLDGGAWFYNCLIQGNRITKVTNGIYVNAGAVCGQSMILRNAVLGSSKSIENAQATDIVIAGNWTKPAVVDAGAAAGDNTTLS